MPLKHGVGEGMKKNLRSTLTTEYPFIKYVTCIGAKALSQNCKRAMTFYVLRRAIKLIQDNPDCYRRGDDRCRK